MDPLSAYPALAVTAMLVFYALEPRSPIFVLAFAGACLASAGYGFLQGAWPFGIVELVWSGVAFHRRRVRAERLRIACEYNAPARAIFGPELQPRPADP